MKKITKFLVPVVIILVTVFIVKTIMDNPPQTKKRFKKKKAELLVETSLITQKQYHISLDSYGVTQPSIKSELRSQVNGKIVYVSQNLKNGAFIKKGELLLQIEDVDYKVDVEIAKAKLTLAKQTLIEEQAKANQAKEDWQKFNKNVKANALILREPQVEAAKANVQVAKSDLQKAQLQLKRTKIFAPYNGRVIEKNVSISEVISSNTKVATISSHETMEIRLPLKNTDLKYIDLDAKNKVTFYSSILNKEYEGEIVRSESSIDTNTKQLYLIGQIKKDVKSLKIGEYLKAKISAKKLANALLIPNSSIYQGSYVYVEKDGIITRREIEISWQDETSALISKGLKENENLVTTTLGLVNSGTKVNVINKEGSTK